MKQHTRTFGFTLLELLVVIVISAVVSTIGMTILFRVQTYYSQINKQAQLANKVGHAFDRMQQDFDEVLPSSLANMAIIGVDGLTEEKVYMGNTRCEDDVLTLPVSVVDPGTGQVGTQTVSYYIDRSAPLPRLMFATAPLGSEPVREKAQVIIEGAWQLQVEYSDGQAWLTEWAQPAHPDAVRVHLVVSDVNQEREQVSRKRVFPIRVK